MTLLTKKEAASFLRVSTRTLDRLCAERMIPFSLVGSRKRFDKAAIESFIFNRSFGSHHQLPRTI